MRKNLVWIRKDHIISRLWSKRVGLGECQRREPQQRLKWEQLVHSKQWTYWTKWNEEGLYLRLSGRKTRKSQMQKKKAIFKKWLRTGLTMKLKIKTMELRRCMIQNSSSSCKRKRVWKIGLTKKSDLLWEWQLKRCWDQSLKLMRGQVTIHKRNRKGKPLTHLQTPNLSPMTNKIGKQTQFKRLKKMKMNSNWILWCKNLNQKCYQVVMTL